MTLIVGQLIGFACSGWLAGYALLAHGWSEEVIVPLLLALIAALISWLGPQIVNELTELNDQLAGRSPEFHDRLGGNPK